MENDRRWPPLPLGAWKSTRDTLHMWTQVVGKMKVELSPFQNQLWQSALHLTARGLTTEPMPCTAGVLQADFDFLEHRLDLITDAGGRASVSLYPRSVADFYRETMARVAELGVDLRINTTPQEVPSPIPFDQDEEHASYDRDAVGRWFRILTSVSRVMWVHRSHFVGKASPVHFFWGAFDLTATRHSGDPAPVPAGKGFIYRCAENEANWAGGFWPGSGPVDYPAFFAYVVPEPPGFAAAKVSPGGAAWSAEMHEFLLPYDAVRLDADPEARLMEFLQSTYEAGATLAGWDRSRLEIDEIPHPRRAA